MSEELLVLEYHGKPMDPHPKNRSLAEIRERMLECQPVDVDLQPGDGTRYAFLIVPLASLEPVETFVDNWRPGELPHVWAVTLMMWDEPYRTVLLPTHFGKGEAMGIHRFAGISEDQWTQQVLCWWFRVMTAPLGRMIDDYVAEGAE